MLKSFPLCSCAEDPELKKYLERKVRKRDSSLDIGIPVIRSYRNALNILVGCTGSVATVKIVELLDLLKDIKLDDRKTEIKVILTKSAFHFVDLGEVQKYAAIYQDDDEWEFWREQDDPALHTQLRDWADVLVIAPIGANSLAKIANGMCDNLLTCVVRGWDEEKPLIFCPAMNTVMWEHPVTSLHTSTLANMGFLEVTCVKKTLACGDVGFGGMASVNTIVGFVTEALIRSKVRLDYFGLWHPPRYIPED